MRIFRAEYRFRDLKIKLYEEDLLHAEENHPGEVSLDKIKSCVEDPDKVIASSQGHNGCLFYERKERDNYFVVVVHITGPLLGEIRTAYNTTYVKKGTILYDKEKQ